ncbi:MAG: hypothetical protein Tsb0021_17800 [Chlamydiales bacterium]
MVFSIFELESNRYILKCAGCQKQYLFSETLCNHLRKFEALCRQLVESEEILSQTSVGIRIGETEVEVPYRLLLSRLNSMLELSIDGKITKIEFRLEPSNEIFFNKKGELEYGKTN